MAMIDDFTVISYNDVDLSLIKNAKCTLSIVIKEVDTEVKAVAGQDAEVKAVVGQDTEVKAVVGQDTEVKAVAGQEVTINIDNKLLIDIINKNIIINQLKDVDINFTDDNTIIINNSDKSLSLPFSLVINENILLEVSNINFIENINCNNTIYKIIINSKKYYDFIITDDKYKENVDKFYDFINKYKNRNKTELTGEEIHNLNKYNELKLVINMTNDNIEKFIDELNEEINIKEYNFNIQNCKKKDYIILRTLNDLLRYSFTNIINEFGNSDKNGQIILVKKLVSLYVKYYDNVIFYQKCYICNDNYLYNTIIAKSFQFYIENSIIESLLCFIKYAPEYCDKNYFPIPETGKIIIDPEYEKELLNNKYFRDIYLGNKTIFFNKS
jgi:hypothetical protein